MSSIGYNIVRNSIRNISNHSLPPLSQGPFEARAAVAKHFQSTKYSLSASDVILTHGVNMGLFNILLSVLNPGDNILVPVPGYPFYHLTAPVIFHY